MQTNINELLIYYRTHPPIAPHGNGFFESKRDKTALGGYSADTSKPLAFGTYDVSAIGAYIPDAIGYLPYVLNCGAVNVGTSKSA